MYLVRHGETDWNINSLIQGHTDIDLNKKGKVQAKQLVKLLKHIKFNAVFSSDLIRAKRTAEMIASKAKVKVQTTPALRERYFGRFEGKSYKTHDREIVSLLNQYRTNVLTQKKTIIESDQSVINRLIPFMKKVARDYIDKTILMVSHGGTMRCFLIHLGFATYEILLPGMIKNLGYIKIKSDGKEFFIEETFGIKVQK